jgi:hypothetical protein
MFPIHFFSYRNFLEGMVFYLWKEEANQSIATSVTRKDTLSLKKYFFQNIVNAK